MPSLRLCLALASTLLAVVPANARLSFHDLTRLHYARKEAPAVEDPPLPLSEYRYLNDNTAAHRVKSLPSVPFDVGEMYSGLMPIDKKDPSRALFYIWQPKIGKPVDEVVIWLNGGPGCSSLGGFFQESGRFTWQPGTYKPVQNLYSWVNLTNMLWVEQPVGTGFSIGKVTAKTEEEIAQDFIGFFANFQKLYGIKNYKIYVTGESYAGRYVPYIAAAMLNEKNKKYYDMQGIIVYDPVIGDFTYTQSQVTIQPLVEANKQLFNFHAGLNAYLKKQHANCGYEALIKKYLTFPPPGHQPPKYFNATKEQACDLFDLVLTYALKNNPCFNIYEINNACPLLSDVLSFPTILNQITYPTYFNRADVKKALHAPKSVDWHICAEKQVFVGGPKINGRYQGGPQAEGDLSADPIQKVLPQVIEATNRVLVSNGDYDMIIISQGTLMAIQNMTWNGKLGFQEEPSTPFHVHLPDLQNAQVYAENGLGVFTNLSQGVMGRKHYERGLLWVQSYAAGHMQPQYQPRAAYLHMQWLLRRINKL